MWNSKATPKMASGNCRIWCYTIHADEEEGQHVAWPVAHQDNAPLYDWVNKKCFRYTKYQVERAPTTGKIHLQGFLCLTRAMRLGELKRHYSDTAHWEVSRGTIAQNEAYCSKEETRVCGPFELGEKPQGGAETTKARWTDVKTMVESGYTRNQILMAMPILAPQFRGIDALIEASRPPPGISREIKVFYIYGPTGVGKTHHALTRFPNAYLVRGAYNAGKSFDQYLDENELILDEWNPFQWPIELMNSITDKWKCPLQCRYQNKYARWTIVVITTNVRPEECYSACLPLQRASFQRRVSYHMELTERVETMDWDLTTGVASPPLAPTPPPDPCNAPTPFLPLDDDPNF